MTTSTPQATLELCSYALHPPIMHTDLRLVFLESLMNSDSIWIASSLVGAKIIEYGPSSMLNFMGGSFERKSINGVRKAQDLPIPVGAIPIIFHF